MDTTNHPPDNKRKHGGKRTVLCWQEKLCQTDRIVLAGKARLARGRCDHNIYCCCHLRAVVNVAVSRNFGKCRKVKLLQSSSLCVRPEWKVKISTTRRKPRRRTKRLFFVTCILTNLPGVWNVSVKRCHRDLWRVVEILTVIFACLCTGGCEKETCWVFSEVTKFAIYRGDGKKTKFQYSLPFIGDVCHPCWILSAGYQNANNGRVRSVEAQIRKGVKGLPARRIKTKCLVNATSYYARAFMREYYIFKHAQNSPCDRSVRAHNA